MRSEVAARAQLMAVHQAQPSAATQDLLNERILAMINQSQQTQFDQIVGVNNDWIKYKNSTDKTIAALTSQVTALQASLNQPGGNK